MAAMKKLKIINCGLSIKILKNTETKTVQNVIIHLYGIFERYELYIGRVLLLKSEKKNTIKISDFQVTS